ncbi:hypothetical protein UR09_01900 [Candidatus Nitromaritima sp. SCGC AAA799-A02]|nr:hypothetical protein UZ36_03495 [Candidatus Nitromaritima sp. SCGC AAA799-C22]KMP12062.1 hypothetical protein UR09_01900 [Candidatus Nitromaritima sp. SCGC AAA799-A02]
MIENFGSYIKRERELRGVPLEEISATTKIHIRFLQALENNQFDELPGEVFVKGYIRSFAKTIGSDEDEMLNAYDDTMDQLASTQGGNVVHEDKPSRDNKSLFGLGIAILFLAGVGWGANTLIHKFSGGSKKSSQVISELGRQETTETNLADLSSASDSPADEEIDLIGEMDKSLEFSDDLEPLENLDENPSSPLSTQPVKKNENPPEIESNQDKVLESKAKPDIMAGVSTQNNGGASVVQTGDKKLRLTITVREDAWFNMVVDGSRVEDFILPKGTGKTFYGTEFFRITIGNRRGVDLKLNDRNLVLPEGDENNVVKDFIINSQLIE